VKELQFMRKYEKYLELNFNICCGLVGD